MPERVQAAAGGLGLLHHHAGAGAVRELAGIAGGDEAAFLDALAVLEDRLQRLQPFQRGVGAVALVLGEGDLLLRHLPGGLVLHRHGAGHRHDLGLEPPGGLGGGGALLRLQGVFVLRVAADAVAVGDDLRRLQHGHVELRDMLLEPGVAGAEAVHLVVLHERDGFQPAADRDLHAVRDHLLRRGGDGHQAGGALPIERHAGDAVRQPGAERALPGEIAALAALLQGGAHDDVLDLAGVELARCTAAAITWPPSAWAWVSLKAPR